MAGIGMTAIEMKLERHDREVRRLRAELTELRDRHERLQRQFEELVSLISRHDYPLVRRAAQTMTDSGMTLLAQL
jgi:predicted  nucleic acid-binding Zn-ribbon protein